MFGVFDKDKSGTISIDEFKEVLRSLGETMRKEEIEDLLEEVDTNHDGEIGNLTTYIVLPFYLCLISVISIIIIITQLN